MLAKHQKIEQFDIISMDILNETELITNSYEYNKGIEKTLEIKLKHPVGHYNH